MYVYLPCWWMLYVSGSCTVGVGKGSLAFKGWSGTVNGWSEAVKGCSRRVEEWCWTVIAGSAEVWECSTTKELSITNGVWSNFSLSNPVEDMVKSKVK